MSKRNRCCVPNCSRLEPVTHRFPVYYEEVYNTWLERIGHDKLQQIDPRVVKTNYVVCDMHFSEECKIPNSKKLKLYSLPTLYLPGSTIYSTTSALPDSTTTSTSAVDTAHFPIRDTSLTPAKRQRIQDIDGPKDTASESVDNNPDSNLLPTSNENDTNNSDSQKTQLSNQFNINRKQSDLGIIQNDNTETTNKVSEEEDSKCEDCQKILTYSSAFMKHDGSVVCDKCAASLLETPDATIPPTTLEILTCSSCRNFLSCGPVFLNQNEEAICGRCVKPGDILIRNKHYEALAKLFKFPCRFQKFGCGESVPFSENSEDSPHEKGCLHRRETCPILTNNIQCSWIGKGEDLLKHCREEHSEQVVESPCSIIHDFTVSNVCTFVLTAFNFLFLLHTKVCLETRKIYYAVQHLTEPDRDICDQLKYKLDVRKGNKLLLKQGCIVSRCRLDYSTKTCMITNFSSLEKTFNDYSNCIFTVTVVKLTDCVTKCAKCGAVITMFLHKKNDDWFCTNCAPEILKIRIKT